MACIHEYAAPVSALLCLFFASQPNVLSINEQYEARDIAAYIGMQDVEQRRNAKFRGGLAQLGEHLLCKQGVNGSIPLSSTKTQR